MAARLQHLLLCVSVAVLLVIPSCCNASRTASTRSLLPSTSASDDDTELPTNDTDLRAPISAKEKEIEFNQRVRFQQVEEVAVDYTPPEANPDPGDHLPLVTRRENISLCSQFLSISQVSCFTWLRNA